MNTIYPLHANKKDRNILTPSRSMNTEECIARTYDLWLREYLVKDEKDGDKFNHRYRLVAKQPHSIEMALTYDIQCPRCSGTMKQVGRCLNSTELGEYACKQCDTRRWLIMKNTFTEKLYDIADAGYERTFWNAMRGRPELLDTEVKGKDESTGLHVLPLGTNTKFVKMLTSRSAFRDIASVYETYDSSYKFFAKDTDNSAAWVPETGQIPVNDAMKDFDALQSESKKLATILKLEYSFIHDIGFDVESYLIERISKTFSRGEDDGFINGDGITSPFGILHPERGALTGVETDALGFDDVISLFFSLDPEYRKNGTWMMNDETALYLRSLKDDTGNYLWRESDDSLLGRPVRISNHMPGTESGKCPVAFGDFSYYWIVVSRPLMVRVLSEKYVMEGKIGYLAVEILNGFLIRRKAIKTIKIS